MRMMSDFSGVSADQMLPIVGELTVHGADFADIYLQHSCSESWMLEEGIVKEGTFDIASGFGVRAVQGDKAGYAHSDIIELGKIQSAAKAASSIVHAGSSGTIALSGHSTATYPRYYPDVNPISTLTEDEKVSLLKMADHIARAADPRVKQVIASITGSYTQVMILNSDGVLAQDTRPLVRFYINVIVEQGGRRESGTAGGGRRLGYEYFIDNNLIETFAKEAVRQALVNLDAVPAPAGEMPVVLGSGWPGILLHEAIGHGLEGDFNRKGSSAFSGRMGERVASPLCTVVDDGTLAHRRGSLNMDDEGTPTECTTLIENGILKSYMQDRLNAQLMGVKSTGNGRRESYMELPLPRMRNTYMLAGEHDPEEIIRSVKKGIYAVNFGGGQVDITSGSFVFCMSEAYLIEEGKLTHPVKDATLIGHGPEVLNHVSMVGNDLALDTGVGTCGKDGQSVPVGVGQPTLLVDKLTVGGTA